jgi:replicative DNA helicase
MGKTDNNSEAAAEILIGAVLEKPSDHLMTVRSKVSKPELWPAVHRGVFSALVKLADANRPLTAEVLAHESGIDVDRLLRWQATGVSVTAQEVDENCRIVIERGKERLSEEATGEFMRSRGKASSAARRETLARRLAEIDSIETMQRASDGKSRVSRLRDTLATPPAPGARTGLGLLDAWTWNFRRGASTLIASRYKGRKSTLVRNVVLAAAGNGAPVAVATLEDSAEKFDADCVSMIANTLLLGGYIKGATFSADDVKLSGDYLLQSEAWKKSTGQSAAVARAMDLYEKLPIIVYDTRDGARDPWTLKAKFRKDSVAHGARLLVVDYIQLMQFLGEGIYDRMVNASDWLTVLPVEFNVHTIVVAQKNEDGVQNDSGYSPKIKGGGDLPAGAHATLITGYDAENEADRLKVELKLSRGSRQGQKEGLIIEPNCGVVTGWANMMSGKRGTISILPAQMLSGGTQGVIAFTQAAASAPADDDLLIDVGRSAAA